MSVGHRSAGLGDHQRPCRVVPDLLLVVRVDGQPQVNLRPAVGHRRVLGLAVQSHRFGLQTQCPADHLRTVVGAVSRFYRFTKSCRGRLVTIANPHGPRITRVVSRSDTGATVPDGRKHQPAAVGISHPWTSQDGDFDPTVDDQCQGDGVLTAPEKPLGPVDWIERPEAVTRCRGTTIDPVADGFSVGHDISGGQFTSDAIEEPGLVGLPQHAGVFLTDHGVSGQVRCQRSADEGLAAEIGDRDRAAITFFENTGIDSGLYGAAKTHCLPYGQFRSMQFIHHSARSIADWRVCGRGWLPRQAGRWLLG